MIELKVPPKPTELPEPPADRDVIDNTPGTPGEVRMGEGGQIVAYDGNAWVLVNNHAFALQAGEAIRITDDTCASQAGIVTYQQALEAAGMSALFTEENTTNDDYHFSIRVVNERDICKTYDNVNILTITYMGLDDRYHPDSKLESHVSKEGLDFLNGILYRIQTGELQKAIIDAMRARLHDHGFKYIDSINQAIKDNCIPMFWACTCDPEFIYTRDTAKDAINYFKAKYQLTKKQWKDLCNLDKFDLHIPYIAHGHWFLNVSYPRAWVRSTDENYNFNKEGWEDFYLHQLMTDILDGETDPGLEQYKRLCGDFKDLCRVLSRDIFCARIPQVMHELSRKKNMTTFAEQLHTFEREFAEIIEELEELKEQARDAEFESKFQWIDKAELPKEIIFNKNVKGTLISTPKMLRAEGRVMKHCVNSVYKNRVADKQYVVYHITDKTNVKHEGGELTLGLRWQNGRFEYDQMRGICNYGVDTTKNVDGIACKDKIIKEVNKHIQEVIRLGGKGITSDMDEFIQIADKVREKEQSYLEKHVDKKEIKENGLLKSIVNFMKGPGAIDSEIPKEKDAVNG